MPLMLYLLSLQHAGAKTANMMEFHSFICTESKEKESGTGVSAALSYLSRMNGKTVIFLLSHGGTELNRLDQRGRDLKQKYDSLMH